jgi:hypothetical protein
MLFCITNTNLCIKRNWNKLNVYSTSRPKFESYEIDLTDGVLKNNFNAILDFITDICKVSNAFISIKLKHKDFIISKKGLDNFNTPNTIL